MAHAQISKAYSANTGAANTFSYSGSFDTFKASEVVVLLDNTALTFTSSSINESASPREYTVDTTAKTIHIGGGNLSSGTIIIKPVTDVGSPTARATYTAGSSIKSDDLNQNQTQLLRKSMEIMEQKLSTTGGTLTGSLTMDEDTTIVFEGATADAYETTLTVTDPTADRTITLPNVTGTVVTTGDTGTVTATMMAADAVDSAEIVDGSIDTVHIADLQVTAAKIASNAVTTAKINGDAVTGAKIADDSIDSEHYVDGSIDTAHIANLQVTTAKIAADAITGAKIADDQIDSEHLAAGSIDNEHIADGAIDSAAFAAATIVTNSEQSGYSVNDTSFFTTSAAEARYFNQSTSETIKDGDTFPDNDTTIATTAAINDRIIDLVDEVGGFVPIADESDFPATNPDINSAAGTIVSIGTLTTSYTPSGGTVTIPASTLDNLSNDLTITGCGSTVLATGFGVLVETKALSDSDYAANPSYTFHRLTPKATEVTTVAGSIANVNTAATNISSINDFADKYRIASSAPGSNNDDGDLYYNTTDNKLYVYDGSAWTVATTLDGSGGTITGDTRFNDSVKAKFGTGSDLEIYHDGSNSRINDAGTGNLQLQTGGSTKFEVTSAGATVTGTLTADLADNSIDSEHYVDGSIDTAHIADLNVTTAKIAADAITGAKIADDALDSEHYTDGSIDTAHLAADCITGAKVADDAIDSEHYTDGSIDTAHIGDNQVTADKLAHTAVTAGSYTATDITVDAQGRITSASSGSIATSEIANDAITNAKIADDQIDSEHYVDGSIDTAHLANDAVTGAKIADNAIDSEHYTDGSIDTAHIADLNVTTAKIAADAITGAKIADDALDSEHYTDGSIDAAHIASNAVTTAKINADAVTGAKIADDAIDSEHYTDGSVDTAHIGDDQVTYAKIQNVSTTDRVLGRDSSGAGVIEEITPANLRTMINVEDGADVTDATNVNSAGAIMHSDLGTKGQIIVGDGSGDATILGVGSNTHVLTADSSEASGVKWASAASASISADSIDSEHYVDGSIDAAHIASNAVTTAKINADAVTGAKIADDAIDSEHYTDASVDHAHLANDCVDGDNIADDSINSEHYVDASIDAAHIASNAVTTAKINADAVTGAKIADDAVGAEHIETLDANLDFADAARARFGASSDIQIYHDSGSNYIKLGVAGSTLKIDGTAETLATFTDDGACELNFNNSTKFDTVDGGARIHGYLSMQGTGGHIYLPDEAELKIGSGEDLKISHSGSTSFIKDVGTGNLEIWGDGELQIKSGDGSETKATFDTNGSVDLYYDNSKKFETTSAGATVTGTLTADLADDSIDSEHYVDGSIDTAHIADNQITLAKMAGGTDGQIITYDASGDPVAVGPGTDGQVLTSTGAGSPPAFEDVAGGGKILQVVQGSTTTEQNSTSTSMADTGLSASITPASNSDVLVIVNQVMRQYRNRNSTNNQGLGVNVLRGSTIVMESKKNDSNIYNDFHTAGDGANNETWRHTISFVDTNPGGDGSTALTYKTQFALTFTDDSGEAWAQPSWEAQNQAPTSYIMLMEISGGVT